MEYIYSEDGEVKSAGEGRVHGYHETDFDAARSNTLSHIGQDLKDTWSHDDKIFLEGDARVLGYNPGPRFSYVVPPMTFGYIECVWCGNQATRHGTCTCCNETEWVCDECFPSVSRSLWNL